MLFQRLHVAARRLEWFGCLAARSVALVYAGGLDSQRPPCRWFAWMASYGTGKMPGLSGRELWCGCSMPGYCRDAFRLAMAESVQVFGLVFVRRPDALGAAAER